MPEKSDGVFVGITLVAFLFYLIGGGLTFWGASWIESQGWEYAVMPPSLLAIAVMFAINTGLNNFLR